MGREKLEGRRWKWKGGKREGRGVSHRGPKRAEEGEAVRRFWGSSLQSSSALFGSLCEISLVPLHFPRYQVALGNAS